MIGIGKTLFYSLASSGAIGPMPVELGSKKLYRVEELTNWVNCGCPPRHQWVDILSHEENGVLAKGGK